MWIVELNILGRRFTRHVTTAPTVPWSPPRSDRVAPRLSKPLQPS